MREKQKKNMMLSSKKIGKLFVVSAPSGTGKTTLVEQVVKELGRSHKVSRVVTYTTKKPRPHDVDGVDYYFVSKQEFEAKIQENFFLEWSDSYGDYYGTPVDIVSQLETGDSYIAIVDRHGAASIKKVHAEAVLIWITPPSFEVLTERLVRRATECTQKIQFRLELAQQELESEKREKLFDYELVNNDLVESISEFRALLVAELEAL